MTTAALRRRRLPPAIRMFFLAQDPRRLLVVSDGEDRAELRLPSARPRLREPRHAADGLGRPRTTRDAARASRRAHRHDGQAYRVSAEMARRRARSRLREERRPHDGRDERPRPRPPRHRDGAAPPTTSSRPRSRTGTRRGRSASLHGYRNAQATVLAPTGTIGLLMDCDTTGIEPDFALVKFRSSPAAASRS